LKLNVGIGYNEAISILFLSFSGNSRCLLFIFSMARSQGKPGKVSVGFLSVAYFGFAITSGLAPLISIPGEFSVFILRITQYCRPRRIHRHQRRQQIFHFPRQMGFIYIAVRPQAQQLQLSCRDFEN
jgi:hypothetical protein